PGIVLGRGLATRLGVEVGSRVRVVVPAEVGGAGGPPRHAVFDVLDTMSTGTSELDRNMALMHLSAGQALFFREGRVTGIEFELTDPELAETVADQMAAELPQVYRISTWRETNSPMLMGLQQIRATLSVVLGLMVLVSASSLIASLLLLVRRKRHDIAVMMAVGGSRSLVLWVFEAVGLFAGAVGATLGLALGGLYCLVIDTFRYPLGSDIYPVDHLPVVIRAIDALGPAVAAVLLCGLASGPVAMMAARVRVVASLSR
ncbi:MAG: FtsX-like permease family protein, partial [Nannocystaceae bacterium]